MNFLKHAVKFMLLKQEMWSATLAIMLIFIFIYPYFKTLPKRYRQIDMNHFQLHFYQARDLLQKFGRGQNLKLFTYTFFM